MKSNGAMLLALVVVSVALFAGEEACRHEIVWQQNKLALTLLNLAVTNKSA